MGKKVKGTLRAKDYFGTLFMSLTDAFAAGLMTSWFMKYLTDYSGIAGAAAIGTTILFVMRLFDAVNDPIEAWIMDKTKAGKWGKYKPFILLSIIFEFAGVAAMFFIPEGVAASPVLAIIWVVVAYLLYDIGGSFFAPNLIHRSLTLDAAERGKLMIAPRMVSMIFGMVTGSFISIVGGVKEGMGISSFHNAFGVTVLIGISVLTVISLVGVLFLIKERFISEDQGEKEERVKLTDIIKLFKENDALRVRFLSNLFAGFIWTFMFATMLYYIQYAFCTDLTTGELNVGLYGTYSLIGSMMMLFPLIIGTLIATPLLKAFGSAKKLFVFDIILEAVPLGIMFVLQMCGILSSVPIIFFILMAISAVAIGINYIPGEVINIECMDYEVYKNGKDRSALCNASTKFLEKLQSAFSAGIVGIVLVAIGYEVDSVTGNYIGSLESIPTMNNWFIVIMGLVPFILGAISILIFRKYPITPEVAAEMKEKLAERKVSEAEQ